MARSGARWRDLPERFDDDRRVKRRYYDWVERRVLEQILKALRAEADLEWLMVDATVIRAHQHATCDALGNPLPLIAGPGQDNDICRAQDLIQGRSPGAVLADRGYDAALEAGGEPVKWVIISAPWYYN